MYRTCIHCCQNLGQNEVIEPFPIGRRLAFDSAKGRLWVVCPHCGRWNLTPLEERWEAVEECERHFRGLRARAQTSNIGLARLSEGLELVRIGNPLRPEFAAWRYGREFSRRRTRYMLGAGTQGLAAAVGLAFSPTNAPLFLVGALWAALFPVTLITLPRGPRDSWQVESKDTMILPDPTSGWRLSIRHDSGRTELTGEEAQRWLSYLLTRLNHTGGSDRLVADAVNQIETTPRSFIASLAEESAQLWQVDEEEQRAYEAEVKPGPLNSLLTPQSPPIIRAGLWRLSAARRLALEMSLHESTEQRAVDGELAALEAAWREAEEIAGIADNLLLPDNVNARMTAEKRGDVAR